MTPAAARAPVRFLDLRFDRPSFAEAVAWLAARRAGDALAYVITPNVDHMVRLDRLTGAERHAYDAADLCLCDSRILLGLARWCGIRLTLVPGSDLTYALFDRVLAPGDALCLVGGSAAHLPKLNRLYPGVRIVHHVPPMGLRRDAAARAAAIAAAAAAGARFTLIAVGSPQQELLAAEMRADGRVAGTALCIGASIDFLVGAERRAPWLFQHAHLEWLWRLARNPRRLGRRYLVDGPAIFPKAWRWRRRHRFDLTDPPR